eukprot:gene31036-37511_t
MSYFWVSILVLALVIKVQGADRKSLDKKWSGEIQVSVQHDVVDCPHHFSQDALTSASERDKVNSSSSFEVFVRHPTDHEISFFSALKRPLAAVHSSAERIGQLYNNINNVTYATESLNFWMFPSTSPSQNRSRCFRLFREASIQPISAFDSYYPIPRGFYLLRAENALVYYDGAVGLSCGRFVGRESCDSRFDHQHKTHPACLEWLYHHGLQWNDLFKPERRAEQLIKNATLLCACLPGDRTLFNKPFPLNISHVDQVFVITATFDINYFHMLLDSLARLVHHLPFLKQNPEVKIHMYQFQHYGQSVPNEYKRVAHGDIFHSRIFGLLGLDPSRIVNGPVYAKVAYIPRTTFCWHPGFNPLEIHLLAKELLKGAYAYLALNSHLIPRNILPFYHSHMANGEFNVDHHYRSRIRPLVNNTKILVLIQRTDFERGWDNKFVHSMQVTLQKHFPAHRVVLLSPHHHVNNNYCTACDMFMFSIADIVVGEHGAGLTNAIFMRPGGLLVEVTRDLNERSFPLCGVFSSLAGTLGIHHYLYAYYQKTHNSSDHMNFTLLAQGAAAYYRDLVLYDAGIWHNFRAVS